MKRGTIRSAIVLAATALTVAAFAAPVSAAPRGAAVHNATSTATWTAESMRAAIPMDQLVGKRRVSVAEVAKGLPSVVLPMAFPNAGGAWTGGGKVVSTAGRVFFTFGGRKASCSGDAVTSGNKSVVVTAGHCVKYQGSWHTDWVFVPAYDNGNAPYGQWAARKTLTTPQWEASEDMNYDVGIGVVNQLDGKSLTDVVGSQGIGFNQARNQNMYAFGYPAAAPYDGSKLIYCSGSTFTDFLLTRDHAMSCNMTGGSSGGPWFLSFNEGAGTGVQASVNSFGYTFLPNYMFGPYFGADVEKLYNTAQAA
ncbi:trypsin-like serine peptidase [Amycolatopsis anabasis]|uniref:trypsin-like serine peptidase n=1 Tax=Amycolatopsis anabasis TaxID=1840409 RepID=UPI00131C977E|nr:peptidase [Amycolatopsis anabasis]